MKISFFIYFLYLMLIPIDGNVVNVVDTVIPEMSHTGQVLLIVLVEMEFPSNWQLKLTSFLTYRT